MLSKPWVRKLLSAFRSPYFALLTSVFLAMTGLVEIVSMIAESRHEVGTSHAITLFGVSHGLKALTELAEGLWGGAEAIEAGEEAAKATQAKS